METSKNIQIIDSTVLADYILESKGCMSHLKIQKLLYLIEGYHLAYFDEPLLNDEFEAWVHGPVSRKLYNTLKDKSKLHSDIIYKPKEGEESPKSIVVRTLASEQIELVDTILSMYGDDTGLELEAITHGQPPWINARRGYAPCDKCEILVSKDEMREYFKQYFE